jgi:hypothetical protein
MFSARSFQRIAVLAAAAIAVLSLSSQSSAQSFPPAWSTTASYAAGDIVQYGGNWFRSMKAQTPNTLSPATTYTNWELNYVRSSTTLAVGVKQAFPLLINAWTFAHNARIADGAYLHLAISTAQGNYTQSGSVPFSLDHGSGADISIIGDVPANIQFAFTGNGFTIDTGHAFALLSGVTIGGGSGAAVYADGNASINEVSNTVIAKFQTGVEADQNASINCDATVQISGFDIGVVASRGGNISIAPGFSMMGTGQEGTSVGLLAGYDAHIDALACTIEDCEYGVEVSAGAAVNVFVGHFNNCAYGLYALQRGYLEASKATLGSNEIDVVCNTGATVDLVNATLVTHTLGTNDGSYIYGLQ